MKSTAKSGRGIDWRAVRDSIDLVATATSLLGPPLKREGRRLLWRCPLHDDRNPSFGVDPVRQTWKCWPCGLGGDAAALVMRLQNCTFPEAVAYLTGDLALSGKSRGRSDKLMRPNPAPRPSTAPRPVPKGLPEADALALIIEAEARLWSAEWANKAAYLGGPKRCLGPDTIRAARLGLVPSGVEGIPWGAPGFTIPWLLDGRLAMVKLRVADDWRERYAREYPNRKQPPKYLEIFRDPSRLVCYPGPEAIRPGRPLLIPEGEFERLLLFQELQSLDVSVVTLGSASARPEGRALLTMLPAPRWFIATDADDAGEQAAACWPARARRVRPPEPFTDWTEAKAGGVDLCRFWAAILADAAPAPGSSNQPSDGFVGAPVETISQNDPPADTAVEPLNQEDREEVRL
jgi:DNA primase